MSRRQLRVTAYEYIKAQISKYHGNARYADLSVIVPLDDIESLKEGIADPSAELVASLKQLLTNISVEEEFEAHLIVPFKQSRVH
jgi:hypothetical protein